MKPTLKEKIAAILTLESVNARQRRSDLQVAEEILHLVRKEIEECLE